MREIKFRVWNGLDSREDSRMIYEPMFGEKFRTIMPDGNEWDLPIMQFTGLKDKDGKDIYEGDIIFNEYGSKKIETGFVDYYNGKTVYYYNEKEYWPLDSSTTSNVLEGIKIIGNIYERTKLQ